MKLKITPADKYFSLCVRERVENQCQSCGNTPDPGGLHCSHYIGRGNWSVRFHPFNAFAHCYGCHMQMNDKHRFEEHYLERYGISQLEVILEAKEDTEIGRAMRRLVGKKGTRNSPVTLHFKSEYKKMLDSRAAGERGWIGFEEFKYD